MSSVSHLWWILWSNRVKVLFAAALHSIPVSDSKGSWLLGSFRLVVFLQLNRQTDGENFTVLIAFVKVRLLRSRRIFELWDGLEGIVLRGALESLTFCMEWVNCVLTSWPSASGLSSCLVIAIANLTRAFDVNDRVVLVIPFLRWDFALHLATSAAILGARSSMSHVKPVPIDCS